MTEHKLKIHPIHFASLNMGKNFEIRFNDRNYQPNDILILMEYDNSYTGRQRKYEVKYILPSEHFPEGIKEGYVIMAIKEIK